MLKGLGIATLFVAAGFISGCSGKTEDSKTEKGKALQVKPTSPEDCKVGKLPVRLEGTWVLRFTADEEKISVLRALKFEENRLTISSTCETSELKVASEVSSMIRVNANDFLILDSTSSVAKLDDSFSCDSQIQAATVRYAFEGSCLRLSDPTYAYTELFAPAARSAHSADSSH